MIYQYGIRQRGCLMPMTLEDLEARYVQNTELCVICGEDTKIPVNLHIYDPKRQGNYIEGAGQTCERCAQNLNQVEPLG